MTRSILHAMKIRLIFFALSFLTLISVRAAEQFTVTVTNSLSTVRPAEVIAVPWMEVVKALPGALLQHLAVRDAAGHNLPYQVTNINPLESDGDYGELLFQHDFA